MLKIGKFQLNTKTTSLYGQDSSGNCRKKYKKNQLEV
jgi:hypothetical protein